MDITAGWSSSVARWAHNPEVVGSNPTPATKNSQVRTWLPETVIGSLIILWGKMWAGPSISGWHRAEKIMTRWQFRRLVRVAGGFDCLP